MDQAHSEYRHPKHDDIVRLVLEGLTDTSVAKQLHMDRRPVARVRSMLGVAPKTNSTSKWFKLGKFSSDPDEHGHVVWNGRRGAAGTPVLRQCGKDLQAAHVAFEWRTGRLPVGICRADCGVHQCVAPAHVVDDMERRTLRAQERALYGLDPTPWTECPEGHDWDTYGRIEPDLTPYCKGCNTDRARRSRAARQEEGTA